MTTKCAKDSVRYPKQNKGRDISDIRLKQYLDEFFSYYFY